MARVVGWRIAAWLIVLVAGVGAFFYARDAIGIALALRDGTTGIGTPAAQAQLGWDVAYFIASAALAALAALVLRGKRRAVLPLRLVCLLVAIWAATGVFSMWRALAQVREGLAVALASPDASAVALASPDASGDLANAVGPILTYMYMSLGVRILVIPVLGWVAWRLGKADVSPTA
jgi:glucose dehydrogenase